MGVPNEYFNLIKPSVLQVKYGVRLTLRAGSRKYIATRSADFNEEEQMERLYSRMDELEAQASRLFGERIVGVDYTELKYEGATPKYFTRFPEIHSIDFSIGLVTSSGLRFELGWDGSFYQYGLSVVEASASSLSKGRTWNLTDSDLWKSALGSSITNVHLVWEDIVVKGPKWFQKSKYRYPQDLVLTFENRARIAVSAAEFLNESDEEVFGMMDNLLVTNDLVLAENVGILRKNSVSNLG